MRSLYLVLAALVAVGCGGGSGSPATSPNTPTNPTTPTTPGTTCAGTGGAVSVVDNAFNPTCMKVTPGSTVTWSFSGSALHNVTFANAALGGSGNQPNGNSYQKAFPTAGTFNYSCTNHPGMNGSVVVE